jgi:hypothetical protein
LTHFWLGHKYHPLAYVTVLTLNMSGCNMSGTLPAELSTLANLRNLDLSNNPRLSGTLPAIYAVLSFM